MLQLEAPKLNVKESVYMNYKDCDANTQISGDCLTVTSDTGRWLGCRANSGVSSSGKYYFECDFQCKEKGLARIGWSVQKSSLNLGTSADSYGYGGKAKKSTSGVFEDYGETYSSGDKIG